MTVIPLLVTLLFSSPVQAAPAGTLVSVTGGELSVEGKPVAPGAALEADAYYKLSAGKAVVRRREGALLFTGPAYFKLSDESDWNVFLRFGAALLALHAPLRVKTPTAVAAVRGTDFYVAEEEGKPAYLCVCSGLVEALAPGKSKGRLVRGEHHTAVWLTRKGGRLSSKKAPMLGHTDEELASLKTP